MKDLDGGDVPLCNDTLWKKKSIILKRDTVVQEMIDLGKVLLKEQGYNADDNSQVR